MYKNTTSPPSPPRGPTRLLRAVLFDGASGWSILGDLREEYWDRADRSPYRADLWYWLTATRFAVEYLFAPRRRDRKPISYHLRKKDVMETLFQ